MTDFEHQTGLHRRSGLDQAGKRHLIEAQLAESMRLQGFRIAANLSISLVMFQMLAPYVAGPALHIWLTAGLAFSALDLASLFRMRRDKKQGTRLVSHHRVSLMTSFAWGSFWGACVYLFFGQLADGERLVITVLVTGMLCTSPFILSAVPAGVFLFSGPLVLASVVAMLTEGVGQHLFILSLLVVYVALFPFAVMRHSSVFRERVTAMFRVKEQNQIIKLFLSDMENHSSEWLWRTDSRHSIIMLSPSFSERSGTDPERMAMASLPGFLLANAAGAHAESAIRQFSARMAEGETIRDAVVHLRLDGRDVWWSLTGSPSHSADGQFTGYHGLARNVSETMRAEAELRVLALTDPLTGLANRAAFNAEMSRSAKFAATGRGRSALALFDLDDFKAVNDTGGHAAGDEVLRHSARRLTEVLPAGSFIARIGGDEFAAIMPLSPAQDIGFAESAVACAIDEVSKPVLLPQGAFRVRGSAGLAVMPDCGCDESVVQQLADEALYSAKSAGKGMVKVANERRNAAKNRRKVLEADLPGAIAAGGLHLEFQPVFDVKTGKPVQFEAFARWNHPEFGAVAPQEFMRVAERAGAFEDFGHWSVGAACAALAGLPADISVSVNISSRLFERADLAEMIAGSLRKHQIAPERLELEITESAYLAGVSAVAGSVARLQAAGVRVVLDDFGTGYSSLTSLCEVPFDKIKIDHELVRRAASDERARVILQSIAAIGTTLGLAVSAEGVENAAEAGWLSGLGCRYLQGWHFGAPMAGEALNGWLLRQSANPADEAETIASAA